MKYLSSCSIVKNESKYIYDFYKIHKFLGVESFLFFDRSTEGPPLLEIFKDHSDVKIIHFPEPKSGMSSGRHAHAWAAGVKYFKGKSKWVQFVDIDQVVVPMNTLDIKEMISKYEFAGSLGLNWHSFGSSNHEIEPIESTYSAYTLRAKNNANINSHIQSIVQVDRCRDIMWNDPHHAPLSPPNVQVNENKSIFTGPFNCPPSQNIGFIAHYYTRSRDYWAKKISKLRADTGTPVGTMEDFDHHQSYLNAEQDLTVKLIWDKVG